MWQNKLNNEKESLLLIKLNHPYDIPEIIGFEIDNEYHKWLKRKTNV